MGFASKRDENNVSAIFGVSSIDLKTPTSIKVNPLTGAMLIDAASLEATLDTRYILSGAAAGGDLTGTYPNPTVVWSHGNTTFDARYLLLTGGTLTGNLIVQGDGTGADQLQVSTSGTGNAFHVINTTNDASFTIETFGAGKAAFCTLAANTNYVGLTYYQSGSLIFRLGRNGDISNGINFYVGSSLTKNLTLNDDKTVGLQGLITTYNGIAAVGQGVPSIYGKGRSTAQTAAVASVATYTVGATDGSFIVSANVLVTTATLHSFSIQCTYTDEGNTARTLTFNFTLLAGTFQTLIANANGAVPYEGVPMHIRAKAGTAITIFTQAAGTYTTVTYNVEGIIQQLA